MGVSTGAGNEQGFGEKGRSMGLGESFWGPGAEGVTSGIPTQVP